MVAVMDAEREVTDKKVPTVAAPSGANIGAATARVRHE